MIEAPNKVLNQEERRVKDTLRINDRIIINKPREVYIVLSNVEEAKSIMSRKKINIINNLNEVIAIIRDGNILYKRGE